MIQVSARKRFQATDDAKWFREIVIDPKFQRTVSAAWEHYTMTLPISNGPNQSCDLYNQQLGARHFMNLLVNIAELEEPRKPRDDQYALRSDIKPPTRVEPKT
jgi:hypothetical protein